MIRVLLLLTVAGGFSMAETITFGKSATGKLPSRWIETMTHEGGPPRWEVIADTSAPSKPNVLAQLSQDSTGGRFPLAIYQGARFKNGTLSVKFKTVSGSVDQAAGIVWRYTDPGNYYIVRANALEDNVVLYKVEKGERLALAPQGSPSKTYGVKHRIPKLTWSTLSVKAAGELFTVSFDGEELFKVQDSTFKGAGKVGLWTKADSATYFDNFEILQDSTRK